MGHIQNLRRGADEVTAKYFQLIMSSISVPENSGEVYRSEEDKIIESLILEGNRRIYDDNDFLPIRQSLYNVENIVPMYDDEISPNIIWCRPQLIDDDPVYFNGSSHIGVTQGSLPDEIFMGALLAVCTFPKYDLMENIFSSKPEDFRKYGIFTCRFYVEGDWVEVITDTNIPCIRDDETNIYTPVYSRSLNREEMWISLAEKAYAKAVGSYEAIPKVRIQEALMHLTGGSVQQVYIRDDPILREEPGLLQSLKSHLRNHTIILALPDLVTTADETAEAKDDDSTTIEDIKPPNQFTHDRFYSIILCREFDDVNLILMHNPWNRNPHCWLGDWGNLSPQWEMYPAVLEAISKDPEIIWTRENPNGYFWISSNHFLTYFNHVYFCKLFPSPMYKFYCVKDEWRDKLAGGPMVTIRDKSVTLHAAMESKKIATLKVCLFHYLLNNYYIMCS